LITSATKETNEPQKISNYRWAVLFASFFAFVVWAFVFQLVPPLLDTFQRYFTVDQAQSGLLMSMVVIPGIFLALPAGFIVNRYGFRSLGILSIASVAVGSLTTALADTFLVALLGRFILGLGGAFLIVGAPTIIPQWFSPKEMGKAMGIYGTNMPVATIIAFPTATVLAQNFGWRYPFYIGTAVSLACALIFAVTVREGPLKGEAGSFRIEEVENAAKSVEVWKVSLVWLFFEATALAYLTWAPELFHTFKGLERFYASILAIVLMIFAMFFVPLFGWASDRLGRRKPLIVAGSICMALSLIAISYASDLPMLAFVGTLGISASMVPPLVMAIVAENLPPRLSGIGFSIITLCQNVGITLSAPLAGYLLQSTQSLQLTFFGISLFSFAGAVTALTIKTK
jgi:MFS family permease